MTVLKRIEASGWVLGVVVTFVSLSWSASQAQELHGLLSSTYSSTSSRSSDGSRADFSSAREILDANWNKLISPALGYRLSLRSERLDSSSLVSGGGTRTSLDTSSTLFQPGLDVTLATPGLSLNGGLRARELFLDESNQSSIRLHERNGFLRLFYSPEQLPSVTLQVERSTAEDNTRPVHRDEEDTRFQAGTQYRIWDVSLGYNYGRLVHEDRQQQATQTQESHVGTLGYAGRFFEDRLAVQADLSLNYSRTLDEFNRAQTAELSRALKATFSLPTDLNPLSNLSAQFLSGATLTPLTLNSAVGFSLTVPETVTEIVISLAPASGIPIPNNLASVLSFNVYHTDKDPTVTATPPAIAWTLVTPTSQTWDPVRSRFTITIPATTDRSFKAWVSADASGVPINGTGIAAPLTVTECAGCQRTQSTRGGTLSAGVSYTPIKAFTVAYNVNLNVSHQDPEAIDTTSGTHTLSLTARPHEKVTTTGTAQYSFNSSSQAGALDTSLTTYTLSVSWTPLLVLSTNAAVARNESRIGDRLDTRNDTASLSAAAKVFPGLNLDSGYALSKAENFSTHQETLGQDLTFKMAAQMAPWISMVGNYGISVRDTSPATPGQDALTITHTVGGGTVYSISRLVNFTTRFDFLSSAEGSSFSQSYKVDWVPTSKMSFFVGYFTTHSHFGDAKTTADTITANGRWRISRVLDLSADYSFSRVATQGRIQDIQSVSVTGSARF